MGHDKITQNISTVNLFSCPIEGLVAFLADLNIAAKARFHIPTLNKISVFRPTVHHFPTELGLL